MVDKSQLWARVEKMLDLHYGWEDCWVIALSEKLVEKKDEKIFRRRILNAIHERIMRDPNYYHRADGGLTI